MKHYSKVIIALVFLAASLQTFCGVYIRTPVLAVVDHASVEKEIFEWGKYYNGRPVTSICTGKHQRYYVQWCVRLMKYIKWHTSKEYYVYILRYEGNKTDSLIVTGDQKFQLQYDDNQPEWTDTDLIYFVHDEWPDKKLLLARFPEDVINGDRMENRWAEIISLVKVTAQDNHEMEFFDVSVDDTHAYFMGKSHIFAHNMSFGWGAGWAFGGGLCQRMAFAPTQYQMNLGQANYEFRSYLREHNIPIPELKDGKIIYKDVDGNVVPTPGVSQGSGSGISSSGGGKNGTDPNRDPGRYHRKSIRSNQEQVEIHRKKIEDDRAGKNLPDDLPPDLREIVKKGQENHHNKEIEAFMKAIDNSKEALEKMGLKP